MARRPLFRVDVRGAGKSARDLDDLQRAVQDELVTELRGLSTWAVRRYRELAPVDTGQLQDAIGSSLYFRAVRPRFTIVVGPTPGHGGDPRDYLAVTRFGHRKETIRAHPPKTLLAVHLDGHEERPTYLPRVRGVRRWIDWAADAGDDVAAEAERSSVALGRRFTARHL